MNYKIFLYRRKRNGNFNKTCEKMEGFSSWKTNHLKEFIHYHNNGKYVVAYDDGTKVDPANDLVVTLAKEELEHRINEQKKKAAELEEKILKEINEKIPPEFIPFVNFLRKNMKVDVWTYEGEMDWETGVGISIAGIKIC